MNFLKIAGMDIKSIFKNRFIRVSVIAIIIVPLLYSLLYLDAFWDPYSRLSKMPVAVVNLDEGSSLDGENVNYGQDVVDNLKDNESLGWKFVTNEEADRGLEGDGYYAKFVIPKDFSSSTLAAKNGAPQVANLKFVCNEKKNFLASQINSKVEGLLKAQITSTISNQYLTVAFEKLYEVKDGMVQAADGSKQIYDGMAQLNEKVPMLEDGTKQLADGSSKLVDGQGKLNTGLGTLSGKIPTLSSGVDQLYSGANKLNTALEAGKPKIKELSDGAVALEPASEYLASSSTGIKDGYGKVKVGVDKLIGGVNASSQTMASVGEDLTKAMQLPNGNEKDANIIAALKKLQALQAASKDTPAQLKELKAGSDYLGSSLIDFDGGIQKYTESVKGFAAGTTKLIGSVSEVSGGVSQLSVGLNDLKSNIPALSEGVTTLYSGSNALVDGQTKLNTGINEISTKVPQLKDGITKLYDGSKELNSKLGDGATEIKAGLINSPETMGEYIGEPAKMNVEPINPIPNYGTGFAPYFIALSLWIGAIMMFFVITTETHDDENLSKFDKVAGKFLAFGFIGVLQAVLVSVVVLTLGLNPGNVPLYIGLTIFFSLVFISIIQCLISLLGDAGRLLGIVFLILQLTACAGTFPLELVPNMFKVLNPFMPFTYVVEAYREVISATVINYSVIFKDVLILAIVLGVFLTISVVFKNAGENFQSVIEGRKEKRADEIAADRI